MNLNIKNIRKLKLITTEKEYEESLKIIELFFENQNNLSKEDEEYFEALAILIDAYEAKHYFIPPVNPIEAIKFRMDQLGLEIGDLNDSIGKPNRVYEIFTGKRKLTLRMIKNLNKQLNIPFESLIS